ncbi:MAG TPA: hypothetical protein VLX33_02130 [Nitrososphaerales archaeon]|nr:hypothetical protein [Nitrososphaerales archaeon]
MVRILWFKETTRWSRRGIPLRVVWVSPRQLAILGLSFLLGFVVSAPLPGQTLRLVALGSTVFIGAVVSFWRVKMLTPEQLVLARLRGLTAVPQPPENGGEDGASNKTEEAKQNVFEMLADSAESFTPLSISGRCRRTRLPRKVSLRVDGVERPGAEALATPVSDVESGYTIVFVPTAADMGAHDLEVMADGEDRPIYKVRVDVRVKGTRSLEMKKVS